MHCLKEVGIHKKQEIKIKKQTFLSSGNYYHNFTIKYSTINTQKYHKMFTCKTVRNNTSLAASIKRLNGSVIGGFRVSERF
jgi:hypothetical protein